MTERQNDSMNPSARQNNETPVSTDRQLIKVQTRDHKRVNARTTPTPVSLRRETTPAASEEASETKPVNKFAVLTKYSAFEKIQ